MSGQRELPPLYVRLIGDGSSFKKMMSDANSQAQQLRKHLEALNKMSNIFGIGKGSRGGGRGSTTINIQSGFAAMAKQFGSIMTTAMKVGGNVFNQSFKTASGTLNTAIRSGSNMGAQAIRSSGQVAAQAIRSAGSGINGLMRGLGRIRIGGFSGGGGGGFRGRGRGGFGNGGSMGSGLTERADIYMHQNAIQGIVGSVNDLLKIGTTFRDNAVAIEVFAGSAQAAADVMKEMQDFAIQSPYRFSTITEEARNMMAYGVDVKQTSEIMRTIGDVAGGNENRFNRLSYAMAQTMSIGRLMGTELRQMTEQGFNPLQVIAKQTGISYEELTDRMREGQISAEAVVAAYKVATSAGGDYAGMMNKMANTLGGLISRIYDTVEAMTLMAFFSIEEDLRNSVKYILKFIGMVQDWMKANPAMVKEIMLLVKNILLAAIVFHSLGFAIAFAKWNMHNLFSIANAVSTLFTPFTIVIQGAATAFTALGAAIAAIASGNIFGAIGALLPLVQVLAIMAGAGMGVAGIRDYIQGNGGLAGAFKQLQVDVLKAYEFIQGFFANFQQNVQILFKWIKDNGEALIGLTKTVAGNMANAFINNFAIIGQGLVQAVMIAFQWLDDNIPFFVGRIMSRVSEAMSAKQMAKSVLRTAFSGGGWGPAAIKMGLFGPAAAANLGPLFGQGSNPGKINNRALEGGGKAFGGLINGLKHGFEGFGGLWNALGIASPDFNLNKAAGGNLPDLPGMPIPEAFKADWDKLLKGGALGKGKDYRVENAFGFNTGEYRARMDEFSTRVRSNPTSKNPQLVAAQQQVSLLTKVVELLSNKNGSAVSPANLGILTTP